MTTSAAKDLLAKVMEHIEQVEAGLVPADSPPTFVRPEHDNAVDQRGLPWFFGPSYKPSDEALEEFSRRFDDRGTSR